MSNQRLTAHAAVVLRDTANAEKRFAWLLQRTDAGSLRRKIILAQLTQSVLKTDHEPDDIAKRVLVIFADRLCELEPTTHAALRMIRDWSERYNFALTALIQQRHLPTRKECERIARTACARSS
jgi:hypothetical protein